MLLGTSLLVLQQNMLLSKIGDNEAFPPRSPHGNPSFHIYWLVKDEYETTHHYNQPCSPRKHKGQTESSYVQASQTLKCKYQLRLLQTFGEIAHVS